MKRAGRTVAWRKLVLVVVVGSLVFTGYRYLYPPAPSGIFVVAEPLTYGNTTLTGIIQKDAPIGQAGNYYLSLSDGQVVLLDAQGIDTMIGVSVSVTGYLTPKESDSSWPYLTVSSMSSL